MTVRVRYLADDVDASIAFYASNVEAPRAATLYLF
jgi:hypothetical protein